MRLRTALLLVAASSAAPLLIFSLLASFFAFSQERDSFIATSQARNRALLSAVDAELQGTIYVLRAMAGAANMQREDFESFRRDAIATLGTQPSWQNVVLQRPDGSQVVNARVATGTPLPQKAIDTASFAATVTSGKPAIANLTFAPLLGGEPGVAVRVPVTRDGAVAYVLTAVLGPQSFQRMLDDQRLPADWVNGLVGTDGRVIARVPPVAPGRMASNDYLAHVDASRDGWYRGTTLEGADTFTAFARSDLTGWTIGSAMPSAVILGSAQRAVILMGAGIALSVSAAFLIAFWLSRRIARPMSELAGSAKLLGTGVAWRPVVSGLDEVAQLSGALAAAAQAIQQRDSEIERSQEKLRAQTDALMRANENRATFLALISHELRNFLAPLKAGLALLSKTIDPERSNRTRTMMGRQVSTMARIVDDLVDVGRIDRGELEMRRQRVDVHDVIQLAIDVADTSIDEKQQVLATHSEPGRYFVVGDAVRLAQVLTNLLTNASKYTPCGGRIELSAGLEGGQVIVAVADSGAGFDGAQRDRIFDMFVRLDETRQSHEGGLGIGLTIAKAIIEAHGGKVSATSEGIDRGATFTVRVPADPGSGRPRTSA